MAVGTMEVTLVSAKGLKRTDFFGIELGSIFRCFAGIELGSIFGCFAEKIYPYVVIQYGDEKHTSSTARGSMPIWNEEFKFMVEHPASTEDEHQSYNKILLQIKDHDTFTSDDYLGQSTIYLKGLFEMGAEQGKAELSTQKYRVVSKDGTYHGEIQVAITFIAKAENGQEE